MHSHTLIIERRRGRSRLVAVLPLPGMINVSSHLITTWPAALARDGWRSVNGGRAGLCPRAKISNDSSPRFCKDMQRPCKHTYTERKHTRAHPHGAFCSQLLAYFILVLVLLAAFSCYIQYFFPLMWTESKSFESTSEFLAFKMSNMEECLSVCKMFLSEILWILSDMRLLLSFVSLTLPITAAATHAIFCGFISAGDLRLRPAGAGDEVDWPADFGAPDVPHASEHNAALCQTQSQD